MIQILKTRVHKVLIQIIKVNYNFGETVLIVIYPTTLFQSVFDNNEKMKKEREYFLSRSKLPVKNFFFQSFKAHQQQIHPNEQPSSYSVIY